MHEPGDDRGTNAVCQSSGVFAFSMRLRQAATYRFGQTYADDHVCLEVCGPLYLAAPTPQEKRFFFVTWAVLLQAIYERNTRQQDVEFLLPNSFELGEQSNQK